jgi:predicted nucleic acid-binding protein
MARLVLTDASPLIGLARVDGLSWLGTLFGHVGMPQEVRDEVFSGGGFPDEEAIVAAEREGWVRVCRPAPPFPGLPDLDAGESACIRIALAHPESSLLLMDERIGRAVAMDQGLSVAGTAAVIGMAKVRGLIVSARDAFAHLHASDFRVSPRVIEAVLRRVGE